MKRPIAILLLAVYLFNLVGYSFVFGYFIQQSDDVLSRQLDQHKYNDAELVTISIPLHSPYIQNSGKFERVDGAVEYQGIQYNYVKRMVQNDTLYVQVMANHQKTALVKDKSRFAGLVNDFAAGKKGNAPVAKKWNCTSEYNNSITQYNLQIPVAAHPAQGYHQVVALQFTHSDTPGHPPRLAC